jgi:hypothetical protein
MSARTVVLAAGAVILFWFVGMVVAVALRASGRLTDGDNEG